MGGPAGGMSVRSPSPFVFEWVFSHASERPEAPAVGTPAGWTGYGELATAVRRLGRGLVERGVGPDSFVVLALPASAASVAAALAVQATGGCAVEVNRELDGRSLATILAQTGARIAFVYARDAARWVELVGQSGLQHLYVVSSTPPPPALQQLLAPVSWAWVDERLPPGGDDSWEPTVRDPESPALLVYTSGSTGAPRGVVQTHENIAANTGAICRYLELTAEDRALSILPLFYCYGRSILQTHLYVGGSVFFDHRFLYPRVVMEALGEQRCTGFYGVPLTFELLRRQVDVASLRPESLRYVAQAGGAMHPDTIRWVRASFAPARLFVMYGQTEATARLSYLPPELLDTKAGSIGKGLDNVELRICDEHGNELPPRAVGELVARGPSITPGYFRAPEETAEIFRDGWLRTGDLGWKDEDGFIYLVGRTRDMLKLGGHRVSAAEIEQVVAEHPDVIEAAVVGAPDATGGEAAVAFVVARAEATLDEGELRRFCRERLPAFKMPREFRFVGGLPKTATGKIAKSKLRGVFGS